MKYKIGLLLTLAFLFAPAAYSTETCVGLRKALDQADKSVLSNILGSFQLLATSTVPKEDCGSLATVLDHVSNRKRTGGRRLEDPKPLDVAAAQADLEKALKDEAIRGRVEKARAALADDTAAMIYEAAILDSEGHYAARDLIVSQLIERTK